MIEKMGSKNMKIIIKKIIKTFFFSVFALSSILSAQIRISVPANNANQKIAQAKSSVVALPAVNLMLNPVSSGLYDVMDSEIDLLKKRFPEQCSKNSEKLISVMQAGAPEIAPALYQLLYKKTQALAEKANVEVEDILIHVGQDKESYNLFAKMLIETTITEGDPVSKESRINKLVIGEQALKLFLWDFDKNEDTFSAVIAHEVGHMWCEHKDECKRNEFEADLVGKCLLDDPRALNKGVNMLTLAGNLFNSISEKSSEGNLNLTDVFRMVCVATNTIANDNGGDLGWLGKTSSHAKFSLNVNQAVENASKTANGLADKNMFLSNVCSNVLISCKTQNGLFAPELDKQLSSVCKKAEDALHVAGISPITHPTPLERSVYSAACDKALVR